MNDSNSQPLSLGSGFFVSDDIIVTNAHVIEGASGGTAKLIGDTQRLRIIGATAVDAHADLALLKISGHAPPLALGPNSAPAVGDRVYVVGNPLGLEGTFSEGIISGVRQVDLDSILQMTAPISPGSSGGPVMNASGAVVGIAVATFRNGQNLNLAVPVSYLSRLLAAQSKDALPLASPKNNDQSAKSMLERVGTRVESGITVGGLTMTRYGECEFRLANMLPVDVSNVRLRFLYFDVSHSLMDYEEFIYNGPIRAGLTKTVDFHSEVSRKAAGYYVSQRVSAYEAVHGENWSPYKQEVVLDGPIDPKYVEFRVVNFGSEGSD
jgi:hypothetical protein